jgi:DNA-binding MarR family transcriptional regulator
VDRNHVIQATSTGTSIVRRCHRVVYVIEDQMLSRLERDEREQFAGYLARCIDGLDESGLDIEEVEGPSGR